MVNSTDKKYLAGMGSNLQHYIWLYYELPHLIPPNSTIHEIFSWK